MTAPFEYRPGPAYEELPRWRQKTFVLRTDDYLAGAVTRDEVINRFMVKKEVMKTNSTVLTEGKWIIFVDTVMYVE